MAENNVRPVADTQPDNHDTNWVDNEVGQLRTVLLHRPGNELKRLTPRNNDQLLFDSIPWVTKAQEEHDAFAELLRNHGVEVLLLEDLLCGTLDDARAYAAAIDIAIDKKKLGDKFGEFIHHHLSTMDKENLANILICGITFDELPHNGGPSLVRTMGHSSDFAIPPLPNLLFTRDSSAWITNRVAISSLSMPARQRETAVLDLIYAYHPRFRRSARAYGAHSAPVEGGDVMLLAPGVLAVGVGERTTAAGVESLARSVFADNIAHTVLAVPIAQNRATMHLDTVCTMVDRDAVVMYPLARDSLIAYTLRPHDDGSLRIDGPEPFLDAAARAMGIDKLRVIDTGLDPVTAEREQWDDGNNTLALAPGVVVGYERNAETNDRLTQAGIEVLAIAGAELGSGRGGPRCMSCPINRETL